MVVSLELHRIGQSRRPKDRLISRVVALAIAFAANGIVLGLIGLQGVSSANGTRLLSRPVIIFADMESWPRPLRSRSQSKTDLAQRKPSSSASAVPASRAHPVIEREAYHTPQLGSSFGPPVPHAPQAGEQASRASDPRGRIAESLRRGVMGCASRALLNADDQAWCDQRAPLNGPTLTGSGDPRRDARFARQGARRMTEVEEREAPARLGRLPCDKSGPVADCGVEIKIDLFSSTRGILPNLRNRDD